MKKKLVIYLVDDHNLFREGLKYLLSGWEMIQTVYEAQNGLELINALEKKQPDLVLMDIEMPEMNGIEATKAIIKLRPDIRVIALSMYEDEDFYSEMIHAGAKGFLLKNSKFEDVQQAILDVWQGKSYFSPEILDSIIHTISRKNVPVKNKELTSREAEVVFYICKGYSNNEIAEKLHISKRTVDKHRENILLKSCSKNTAELVVYAIKNKLFDI
jgi:NarL family two-component system response regulator LiaR